MGGGISRQEHSSSIKNVNYQVDILSQKTETEIKLLKSKLEKYDEDEIQKMKTLKQHGLTIVDLSGKLTALEKGGVASTGASNNVNIQALMLLGKDKQDKVIDAKDVNEITFDRPRMSEDTYKYLNKVSFSNGFAYELAECYLKNHVFDTQKNFEKNIEDLVKLIEECLIGMCDAAADDLIKKKWKVRVFNILEVLTTSEFGDNCFARIVELCKELQKRNLSMEDSSPEKAESSIVTSQILSKLPKGPPRNTDYYKGLDKSLQNWTEEDEIYVTQKGELATPKEVKAISQLIGYATSIKESFVSKIGSLMNFHGGTKFHAGVKSIARANHKMNQLDYGRPSFEFVYDLLRCQATFDTLEQISKVFAELKKTYTLLRCKDKLNTPLKNLTLNLVYESLIVEIQLVHGKVASGSVYENNHKLYEIERCQTMAEIYKAVLVWDGWDYSSLRELKGRVLPPKLITPAQYLYFVPTGKFTLRRTLTHGNLAPVSYVSTEDPIYKIGDYLNTQEIIIELSESARTKDLEEALRLKKDENELRWGRQREESKVKQKFISNVSCMHMKQPTTLPAVAEIKLERQEFIQNVQGTHNNKHITSLTLIKRNGETLNYGASKKGDKHFDLKVPTNHVILGFGGKVYLNKLANIYAWFGNVDNIEETKALQSLDIDARRTPYEETWTNVPWFSRCNSAYYVVPIDANPKVDLPCYLCKKEQRKCRYICEWCFESEPKLCNKCAPHLPKSYAHALNAKCANNHYMKWQNVNEYSGDCCSTCKLRPGHLFCEPCKTRQCTTCWFYEIEKGRKGEKRQTSGKSNFVPYLKTTSSCDDCKHPVNWFWNIDIATECAKASLYNCHDCKTKYPTYSGAVGCETCLKFSCSGCYANKHPNNLIVISNFLTMTCSNDHLLTWNYSANLPEDGKYRCRICECSYPGKAGSYNCQVCDWNVCAGCFLNIYLSRSNPLG